MSRGESPEDLARADYEHDALSGVGGGLDALETGGAGSNDVRLKRDVPPHWG
ncbi:transcriptional regulator [uncultured Actinomyces sp.]|uniref:transcriptional regulator n=1 Tax=uncultured Actinomyces sp. TaxID=249061 RepID=UPI0028D4ED47|nr:transcriptional regulator [uncultured Actinomyces sp.]